MGLKIKYSEKLEFLKLYFIIYVDKINEYSTYSYIYLLIMQVLIH